MNEPFAPFEHGAARRVDGGRIVGTLALRNESRLRISAVEVYGDGQFVCVTFDPISDVSGAGDASPNK